MKVLFVLDSLYGGGTERSTAVLLPLLRQRGVDACVAVLRSSSGDEQQLRQDGFRIVQVSGTSWLAKARSLRRIIRAERPDIVHTALFSADVLGRLAGLRTPPAVISSLVNTPYDQARKTDPNISAWKLRGVQIADAITARVATTALHSVSQGCADANAAALGYPSQRILVVDRGRSRGSLGRHSAQRRQQVRDRLGIADGVPLVVTAGRQEYQKAHSDLVLAAAQLATVVPTARVLIAGRDGNASADLQQSLRRYDSTNVVTVLGDRDDVADLMVAADAFCLSSRWEGTAGAALEALALRCPVVSTDVKGLRGVLQHDHNAVLVPAGDAGALAEALRQVLTDPSLADRLRDQGERDFEQRFTIEKSADDMVSMYGRVLQLRGQRK